MTEYKTFDDYVKNTFNIEPRELTHISPEEQKKKTVAITIDELINIWNELTELKLKACKPKWHKVTDGDLPKHEVNVLVLFNEQCIDIAHYNWDYKEWHFTDSIVHDVIAWKEIVLPKEK